MTAPGATAWDALGDPTRETPRQDGELAVGAGPTQSVSQPRGRILDQTDPKVLFRMIEQDWIRTERTARNAAERDTRNTYWVNGRRYVRLVEKVPNQGLWEVSVPLGSSNAPPTPNQINDLRRKTIAVILVDPPAPDCEPENGDDSTRSARLLAQKYLTADGQEGGTDDTRISREAFDLASITRSAFTYIEIHPSAGGRRPKQLMAHPTAPDPSQPLQPHPDAPSEQRDQAYALRHVTPPDAQGQRQFTANPAEAEAQWVPKTVVQTLTPQQCRLLPDTATCDADATGMRLCFGMALDEWRARYEDPAAPWSDEQVKAMVAWRPLRWRALVSADTYLRTLTAPKPVDGDPDPTSGDALCFAYIAYEKARPAYPNGACVVVSGAQGGTTLWQEEWLGLVPLPDGTEDPEVLELPISQLRPLADPSMQDATGTAMVELYGFADEALARIYGSVIEWCYKALHPHAFVTSLSPMTQNTYGRRDDRLIVLGSPDDKVFYEQMPQLPGGTFDLIALTQSNMRSSAGLEQAAQGQAATDVRSAEHARQLIEQSLTSMSEMFQAWRRWYTRYQRIKLQLARCKISVPQLASYVGDDAEEDIASWVGADLRGAKDVRIADGTATMLPPSAKQQLLESMENQGWMSSADAADAARRNVAPMVALEDDPQRERMDRELSVWRKGPPAGWVPAAPAIDPVTRQPQVDPATGQPVMTPPSFTPFAVTPADADPSIATIRRSAVMRLMGTVAYQKAVPPWKQLVDQVYATATQALQAAQAAAAAVVAPQPSVQSPATTLPPGGQSAAPASGPVLHAPPRPTAPVASPEGAGHAQRVA